MQNVREGNSVLFLNNGKNNKNSASTRNGETVSSNQKFLRRSNVVNNFRFPQYVTLANITLLNLSG